MASVRAALKKVGVDQLKYCTHSFRIGAATTAPARGIEDSKTPGRWESIALGAPDNLLTVTSVVESIGGRLPNIIYLSGLEDPSTWKAVQRLLHALHPIAN